MALTVPSSDPASALATQISNLQSIISANTNPALTVQYKTQLPELQRELVDALMASGKLPASAILNSMSYGAADTNS